MTEVGRYIGEISSLLMLLLCLAVNGIADNLKGIFVIIKIIVHGRFFIVPFVCFRSRLSLLLL